MGMQLTERQRKIYKEFVLNPLAKEVSRTTEIGCDCFVMKAKLNKLTVDPGFEQEYNALMKEYDEIDKLENSTHCSDRLYKQRAKFDELGFSSHPVSPNEFEYILNETEKIWKSEKEKNDIVMVRYANWLDRSKNFLSLIKYE